VGLLAEMMIGTLHNNWNRNKMLVMKFGGTSVGDGARIVQVAQIVKAKEQPVLVVASAMTKVTDELLKIANLATTRNLFQCQEMLTSLENRHLQAIKDANIVGEEAVTLTKDLKESMLELWRWTQGVSLLQELTPRTLDAFSAAGELLSAPLVAAALRSLGASAEYIDPRELMFTDENFGAAIPDEAKIAKAAQEKIAPRLQANTIIVTGGFVGCAESGQTTTLGRGGSDYSAALFGAGLHADSIEIWTDVDGILTADPRMVSEAKLLREISYAEAAEMAFFGAKVLHPATIRPAVQKGIPVWIKNTFRPQVEGTVVKAEVTGTGLRALACRTGCVAVLVSNPKMLLAHGYAAKVFSVFERLKVPVDVITTSEVSIATTIDANSPIHKILEELSSFAEAQVVRNLGVLTAVGSRLRSTPGIASTIFRALGDINVFMISQGASDTNITLVLDDSRLPEAMRRLHTAFFEEPLPPR
jgi:aspartate kinase